MFSWQPGEENVNYWSYEEEDLRPPDPAGLDVRDAAEVERQAVRSR